MGATYIIFSPLPLLLSVYVYASVCDFCLYRFTFTICPRVLSVFYVFFIIIAFKNFFLIITFLFFISIILFYFILLYFILFYLISFFVLIFLPFILRHVDERLLLL